MAGPPGGRHACRPAAGGGAVHGLPDEEVEQVLDLAQEWGEVDRSTASSPTVAPGSAGSGSRRPASIGCWPATTWCCPPAHAGAGAAATWPDGPEYRPNQLWGSRRDPLRPLPGRPHAFAIIDLVSRKWLATLLSAEEASTQVGVVVTGALEAEGLMELVAAGQDGRVDLAQDDPGRPLLLAVSDDGPR